MDWIANHYSLTPAFKFTISKQRGLPDYSSLKLEIAFLQLLYQLGKGNNCLLLLQPGVSFPAWEPYDYVHLQLGDLPVRIQDTFLENK